MGPTMRLTYMGNEGVFIAAADGGVLIDALYREGAEPFGAAPPEVREAVETARPPYDGARVVLATHFHHDHFNPLAVARHLEHNPDATFASTPQACALMAETIDGFSALAARIEEVAPGGREPVALESRGIRVEGFSLSHGRGNYADVEQLGWIVHLEGRRILHLGDGIIDERALRAAGVLGDAIDVAIVPFWYVTYPYARRLLKEKFHPGRLLAVHLPVRDAARIEEEIASSARPATALTRVGATLEL